MAKGSMSDYAKRWKSPEERREASQAAAPKKPGNTRQRKDKDTPDSKGPGPNDWTKGAIKQPKGC